MGEVSVEIADWRQVLCDATITTQLRDPANEGQLLELERSWHALPESYRNFLLTHNGGKIGELIIFGLEELSQFAGKSSWSRLIPFHPVTGGGDFECFDTGQPESGEYPVVFWSIGHEDEDKTPTYTDFTDWFFDQVLDIRDEFVD